MGKFLNFLYNIFYIEFLENFIYYLFLLSFKNKRLQIEYILLGGYMFLIFSKEKIATYAVSIFTVIVLFFAASNFAFSPEETVEVSSTEKLLPIYKVKTEEKNVALTMNCAWNADDIDSILGILDENEVKITFFMVGDWIDKFPEYVKKINEAGHEIRKSQQYTSTCK